MKNKSSKHTQIKIYMFYKSNCFNCFVTFMIDDALFLIIIPAS